MTAQYLRWISNVQSGAGAGAVSAVDASTVVIENAAFVDNQNLGFGAGAIFVAGGSWMTVRDSAFRSNSVGNDMDFPQHSKAEAPTVLDTLCDTLTLKCHRAGSSRIVRLGTVLEGGARAWAARMSW